MEKSKKKLTLKLSKIFQLAGCWLKKEYLLFHIELALIP